jgi:hypothetical protein
MLDSPQVQRSLRPALPPKMKVDEILLTLGLRPQLYRDEPAMVWLRPQRIAPLESLSAQAVELQVNLSPEVDKLFSGGRQVGSLLFHEPQKTHLASFDAQSPFGPGSTYTWLVSQMSPSGDRNRRRFVHSLATLDAQIVLDGGWLLPLGQEESLRNLASTYRQLPAARFETLPGESQPVTVRTLVRDRETIVYLVNDSPWSVTATIDIDLPSGCRLEKLGNSRDIGTLARNGTSSSWTVAMRPYDLVAARFTAANVRFGPVRVALNKNVTVALEGRIKDLVARAAALGNPPPLNVLENPGFELPDRDAQVPGWIANSPVGTAAELDSVEKHGGKRSLRLSSNGPTVSLRSAPFEAPQTGRLSVALWLRIADEKRQPTLRLALDGQFEDSEFFRYATVGGSGADAVPLLTQWAPYIFQVDDLPAEGLSDVRVRFDLLGAGEVWIDDIQLSDLVFSNNERLELNQLITLAKFKLQAGQVSDCVRLLEGYWPQFLVANVALTESPASLAQRQRGALQAAREPIGAAARPPRVLDKMKGLVPKFR